MGERKVLNKYYPPDFDPAKLPKLSIPKDRQYVVRLMAPFTMRCLTCGNYVYKGKKFNARKETAIGEKYLGIQIYKFYIKCPQCLSEISFKTDPKNTDYVVDNGAYRTFQAERIAEMEEERIIQEKEEEEANNPMLALENRTKESKQEIDVLDALEEIREWNAKNAQVKFEDLLDRHFEDELQEEKNLLENDQAEAIKAFESDIKIKRVREEDEGLAVKKLLEGASIDLLVPVAKKVKKDDGSSNKKVASMIKPSLGVRKATDKREAPSAPSLGNSLQLLGAYSSSSGEDSD